MMMSPHILSGKIFTREPGLERTRCSAARGPLFRFVFRVSTGNAHLVSARIPDEMPTYGYRLMEPNFVVMKLPGETAVEFAATISHSTRSRGPGTRVGWSPPAAPQRDFARGIAAH
jgi:hypothetical protein